MDRTFKIGDIVNTKDGNFDEGEGTKIVGIAGNGVWIVEDTNEETKETFELQYKTEELILNRDVSYMAH